MSRLGSAGPAAFAALAATLLIGLATAPSATAAPGVKYGLTDDAWLLNGSGTLESRLARLDALGVRITRFTLHWDEIAASRPDSPTDPSDPAYDWAADDAVLDGLREHGIEVVLQLVGTPDWANGGLPANYAPTSAATFRAFATAAAHRYPWVHRWLIWNEPNQVRWLRPTTPAIYTSRLLNPAYTAIHSVIAGAQVGGGATAPRGSTGGVSPVTWLLGMRKAHARLDAYAHNPYPLDPKRETPLSGGCEALHDDHDGDDRQAGRPRDAKLPARAHLAVRVRLPEQPARPAPRHLARAAGPLPRRKASTWRTARRASIS